jgi:membrane-associated phospholipid phosphatase
MIQSKKSLAAYSMAFWVFECLCIGVLVTFTRFEQMTWVNAKHAFFFDYLFRFFSSLAEVFLPAAFAIYLYRKDKLYFKAFLLSYALCTLLVQGAKHLIFFDSLRPTAYFAHLNFPWYLVPGVEVHANNSFPSGHTAGAWFMFFWFALLGKSRFWGICMAFVAMCVAYSRVYLMQHFPIDVAVGACVGFLSSYFVYYFLLLKPRIHDLKDSE